MSSGSSAGNADVRSAAVDAWQISLRRVVIPSPQGPPARDLERFRPKSYSIAARHRSAFHKRPESKPDDRPHDRLRSERRHSELPQHDRREPFGNLVDTRGREPHAKSNDQIAV